MISAVIITKNEDNKIKICLESIKWVDEIIVVDNGSTDHTIEIAKKYTSRIIRLQDQDFSVLRNRGMKEAQGDWVLFVDSDERVLDSLRNEIKTIINNSNSSAYALSRRNIVFGSEVKYGPFYPDWVVRLLRKSDFECWVGKVHEYPKFRGKLGYSKNSLLHLTHRDVDQIVLKSLEWSKVDAQLRFASKHPKMSGWRFLRILVSELVYQGIIRKGFFNNSIGTMDSILQAFSMFITYVRLWQLQQSPTLTKKYEDIDKRLLEQNFKV